MDERYGPDPKKTIGRFSITPSQKSIGCRPRRWWILVALIVWSITAPALSAPPDPAATPPTALPLAVASDAKIETRLQAIVDQIEVFKNVKVDVNEGVVRLSGKTDRMEASEKVAAMVARFEGVVYVDNQIAVESDVESRVKPALTRVQEYLSGALQKLPTLAVALAVVVAFWLLGHLVTRWEAPFRRLGMNPLLQNLFRQFLRKGIFLLGLLLALDILDITALVGALLGTAGVVGLVLGFAFKDIVENYLAGLLLSIRRPFDLFDLVRIESHEGRVTRLTASELILMTLDGNHVRIPNATVFKSFVYNYSINPRRRFDFSVGVGVHEDLVEVQAHGCAALQQMAGVMDDPAPFMIVEDLGDFSVLVRFFGWVDQRSADFAKVRGEAIRRVKLTLEKAGVEMPEPAQTIRLQRVDPAPSDRRAAKSDADAHPAAAQEVKTVDLSPDRQLDDQINEDLAASGESNLLTGK
jgi:small-conductance mechanosensitive channel